MACEGYEHGSRVVLLHELPGVPVPAGSRGRVVGIHASVHKLDVQFARGRFDSLDAHAFAPESESEPRAGASAGA